MITQAPFLMRQKTVCQMLSVTAAGLARLRARDRTFPAPIKMGNFPQSPVYFDGAEVNNWFHQQKAKSGGAQ
jgi:prophage regulatory protein